MSTSLDDLVKLIASLGDSGSTIQTLWATVTSSTPLRVKLDVDLDEDGAGDALDVTPANLAGDLQSGDRVWCILNGRQLVVAGRNGGPRVTEGGGTGGVQLAQEYDFVEPHFEYQGVAPPGTATSAGIWTIWRLDVLTNEQVGGVGSWDDHLTVPLSADFVPSSYSSVTTERRTEVEPSSDGLGMYTGVAMPGTAETAAGWVISYLDLVTHITTIITTTGIWAEREG